jgi:hypothetical protein
MNADRYKAYRQRKKERIEALAREVRILHAAKADDPGRKRSATIASAAYMRYGLRSLLKEMDEYRRNIKARPKLDDLLKLLDHIVDELNRLVK